MQWLESYSSAIGSDEPLILFSHQRLDYLPNADELDGALRGANVILMLSGHRHNDVSAYDWNGRTGISIGHCRDHPSDAVFGRRIVVVRITKSRMCVVPWRWDLRRWAAPQGGSDEAGGYVIKRL